jgi:hypothetical protein
MAIEKTFILRADTKEAQKNVNKLTDSVEGVTEASVDLEKQNKVTAKSSRAVGTSVKAIGTALKAIGIGLVIALFAKLVDALTTNKKAVDFFSTSVEFLGLVFNDLFNFISNNAGGVIDFFKDIFENPAKNIKKLGEAIKENIIERFVSLLEVSGFLATALKKLFTGDFSGALDAVKQAGTEAVDVFTGVDDSLSKTGDLFEDITEGVSNYGKETLKSAKANVELRNSAALAAAQQGRLVEQFDRAAEKQRQIRDEERNTITDRIAANDKLKEVLDDQEKALLSQAGLQIASAQATLQSNDTIEAQVALIDALANKESILAQVEGFRSEQLVNDLALKKEQIELDQTISDGLRERQLAQLAFEAELETDPLKKIEKQKLALLAENEAILEDLERKRELFNLGTQARVDAEEAFLNRKQEINNEEIALNAERNRITEEDDKKSNDKKKADKKALEDAKVGFALNTLSLIGSIAAEGSKVAKGVQVAQTVIEGIKGVQSAYTTAQSSPITAIFPGYPIVQAGLAGVFSALQVKKILSTDPSGKTAPNLGGGAGAGGGGGGQSAPSFNVVGNSGASQLGQTLNQEQNPVQAFVVGSAVTSQQALDRDIVETASLG